MTLTQVSRKEQCYLPSSEYCFSRLVVLCLLVSTGFTCRKGAANKAPAITSGNRRGWISCREEADQVVKTLWKDLLCQLWRRGIHPEHPTPMAPAACHAGRIKPNVSLGLFRWESGSLVPKKLVYFLDPPCSKWDVGEWQHIPS